MSAIPFAVQKAVFEALSASAAVRACLGMPPRLYDHAPPDAVFPYVVWGPLHMTPYDALGARGMEQLITLDLWSHYRGGKETHALFQALYDALHRAALAVEGQVFVLSEFHSADVALEDDGLTYHAAVRFTLITQDL